MIQTEQKIVDQIKKHAERDYPHECGGMLIGHFAADGLKSVVETFRLKMRGKRKTGTIGC